MKINIYMKTVFSCRIILAILIVPTSFFLTTAHAKDKNSLPEIINGIPANWDYYSIDSSIIEKYRGEERSEICLDNDLEISPNRYGTIEPFGVDLNGKASQRGGHLLTGAKDFFVLDKKHVLIGTPQTGATVVEARFCKKSLRRAKIMIVPIEDDGVCLKERKRAMIFTRLNGTYDICKIGKIQTWNGPADIRILKKESAALAAEKHSE